MTGSRCWKVTRFKPMGREGEIETLTILADGLDITGSDSLIFIIDDDVRVGLAAWIDFYEVPMEMDEEAEVQ